MAKTSKQTTMTPEMAYVSEFFSTCLLLPRHSVPIPRMRTRAEVAAWHAQGELSAPLAVQAARRGYTAESWANETTLLKTHYLEMWG